VFAEAGSANRASSGARCRRTVRLKQSSTAQARFGRGSGRARLCPAGLQADQPTSTNAGMRMSRRRTLGRAAPDTGTHCRWRHASGSSTTRSARRNGWLSGVMGRPQASRFGASHASEPGDVGPTARSQRRHSRKRPPHQRAPRVRRPRRSPSRLLAARVPLDDAADRVQDETRSLMRNGTPRNRRPPSGPDRPPGGLVEGNVDQRIPQR